MTPRMLHALRKREVLQLQREEWLHGNIAATVANFGFRAPKEPMTVNTFMIHKLSPHVEEVHGSSGEDLLRAFEPFMGRKKG